MSKEKVELDYGDRIQSLDDECGPVAALEYTMTLEEKLERAAWEMDRAIENYHRVLAEFHYENGAAGADTPGPELDQYSSKHG